MVIGKRRIMLAGRNQPKSAVVATRRMVEIWTVFHLRIQSEALVLETSRISIASCSMHK